MTVNMPIFGTITISPEQIIAGETYVVTAVVTDGPVPVYELSVYSDTTNSGEVTVQWP